MSNLNPLRGAKYAAALLLILCVGLAQAGQTSGVFTVSVTLTNGTLPDAVPPPGDDLCRIAEDPRASVAVVTVACLSGVEADLSRQQAEVPAYRFVTQLWNEISAGFDAGGNGGGGGGGSAPSTGERAGIDAYRHLMQPIWETADRLEAGESGQRGGATTSWRVIHLANREYYEMMVAW